MAVTDTLVVDASIGVKWVIEEEHFEQSRALLSAAGKGQHTLRCPPHFSGEAVNAIYQKYRSRDPEKHIPLAEAQRALFQFLATVRAGVNVVGMSILYQQAFEFSHEHQLPSVYDSIYVVLARDLHGELWTADRRLLNSVGNVAPCVRWIGDYPLL